MSATAPQAAAAPAGPGAINYVEGEAALNGQAITRTDVGRAFLQPGSDLQTRDGFAEVLLTPGAFLRIGHNSDVRLNEIGLAQADVQIVQGTADLEVDQLISGSKIEVDLNGAKTAIEKKGLYNFNASNGSVLVLDGKAIVSQGNSHVDLGKGHEVTLSGTQSLKKHGFDEAQAKQDPLYVWSQARSQQEAAASYSAARNAGAYTVVNTGWFWDPYFGGWGFWPANAFLYSPFGWGFYSPLAFGWYGGGYYGHPLYYRPGYFHGTYHGGFVAAAHPAFHGAAMGGFHGGRR
jgi:hypothetical protein